MSIVSGLPTVGGFAGYFVNGTSVIVVKAATASSELPPEKPLLCAAIQTTPAKSPTALEIYDRATELDEFPGNERDRQAGTSVRAGAKALQERGVLAAYGWARTPEETIAWLNARGPVVIGVAGSAGSPAPRRPCCASACPAPPARPWPSRARATAPPMERPPVRASCAPPRPVYSAMRV